MKDYKRDQDFIEGELAYLEEDGGCALVEILKKETKEDWVSFKIKFRQIVQQYPYVPYEPGDEITIGLNPKFSYSGWRFRGIDWAGLMAGEYGRHG